MGVSNSMEAKATEAEQQIVELKKRVSALESGGSYEAKKEILENLREIRFELGAEKAQAENIRRERDQLAEKNKALSKANAKLEYRVKFLLRTIEEIEGKK